MILVVCAIIIQNNKILAAQRAANCHLAGKWEFPGGKIEHHETEKSAIIREIKEELNITITPLQRLSPSTHHYPNKTIQLIPFACSIQSGTPIAIEHASIKWLSISDLPELNWAEADIPIMENFIEKWKNNSFLELNDIVTLKKTGNHMRRVRIIVDGKVQGIGYRYYVHEQALKTGIFGFVRNLPDGRVEIDAEGRIEQVRTFLEHCQQGPSGSNINNFHIQDLTFYGFENFRIKH